VLLQPHIYRHHILPRGQFPDRSRASADCVANIAFITDTTNRSINRSSKLPWTVKPILLIC